MIHHVKGGAVLLGTAAVIMISVLGLRTMVAPDRVSFAEEVAAAAERGEETFAPSALGGELRVSGDRQGPFSLGGPTGDGARFGLAGDDGRMFFEGTARELAISQFSYDGLEFFPDAGECTVTPGEANLDAGIGGARVECPGIRDIRDSATITVEGQVGLPVDMVMERELPPVGGTVTAGEEEWEITSAFLDLVPSGAVAGQESYPLVMHDARAVFLYFTHRDNRLELEVVEVEGRSSEVPDEACSVDMEELVVLNPDAARYGVTIDCRPFPVDGLGEVPLYGSVVIERFSPRPDGH